MEKKEEKPPNEENLVNIDLLLAVCDKIEARWEAAKKEKAA